jgi:hypothetical protein
MTHEPLDDADDVIPASIAVPCGLPPARAELSRFMSYRAAVAADIARLETGRDRLVLEIAKADAIRTQAEEAFEAEAVGLADRVLSGAETLIAAFTGRPKPAPGIDPKLTRAALARIETELQTKRALADRLQDRYGEFINAALREEGAGLAAEYARIIDELRNHICKMHSLDVACGGPAKRQIAASLPGFSIANQPSRSLQIGPSDHAIGVGVAAWKQLGKSWASDPKAAPSRHLKFVQRDKQATEFSS